MQTFSYPHKSWIEINKNKICSNLSLISDHAASLKIMAVLKANAYGLGVKEIAAILAAGNIDCFGVAEVDSAIEIKHLGKPVHILGALVDEEIPFVVKEEFIAPITDLRIAKLISQEAIKQKKTAICHIKIDTGMGRLGIFHTEALETVIEICKLPGLNCSGIYSHFPHADLDIEFSRSQVKIFNSILNNLENAGIKFSQIHMANSDGVNNIFDSVEPPFTMIRVGIDLYGASNAKQAQKLSLQPAIMLKSRLVAARDLPAGTTIGYGRTFKLKQNLRIGTVAIGYADGIPMGIAGKGSFLINGYDCPIIGRVSMDLTTISLKNAKDAKVGDEVVCLGEGIWLDEWAGYSQTISHQILTSLSRRLERRYISG